MAKSNTEKLTRTFDCEMRAETNATGEAVIVGRPVVFNRETVIGGMFREVIKNGALDGADLSDVLLLVNHNDDRIPLARSRASKKTMSLTVDSEGLEIEAVLDIENNPAYKDTSVIARSERERLEAIREQMESRNKAELELEKLKTLAVYGMV